MKAGQKKCFFFLLFPVSLKHIQFCFFIFKKKNMKVLYSDMKKKKCYSVKSTKRSNIKNKYEPCIAVLLYRAPVSEKRASLIFDYASFLSIPKERIQQIFIGNSVAFIACSAAVNEVRKVCWLAQKKGSERNCHHWSLYDCSLFRLLQSDTSIGTNERDLIDEIRWV